MALEMKDFDRCFEPLANLLQDAYKSGRRLKPGELRELAGACHGLLALLESDAMASVIASKEGSAAYAELRWWHRRAVGLIEPNLDMSHMLTIGYDPTNVGSAREDSTHFIAITYLSAVRAIEEGSDGLIDDGSMLSVFMQSVSAFCRTLKRREIDFSRHNGTMWTLAHVLRTLLSLDAPWPDSKEAVQDLVSYLQSHHGSIEKTAAHDGLAGLLNETIELHKLSVKTFSVGKPNGVALLHQALHELIMGRNPGQLPPIPGYRPTPFHWCVHALKQIGSTGEMPPGRPYVGADNRAEGHFRGLGAVGCPTR